MKPPTKRQLELLRYIDNFCRTHGRGPLYREMQVRLRVRSPNAVNDLLLRLYGKELIDKARQRPGDLWVTARGRKVLRDRAAGRLEVSGR